MENCCASLPLLYLANENQSREIKKLKAHKCPPPDAELVDSLQHAEEEITRLKEGNFTPEEFQNLCHNRKDCTLAEFKAGCEDYQKKLFGCQLGEPHVILKATITENGEWIWASENCPYQHTNLKP